MPTAALDRFALEEAELDEVRNSRSKEPIGTGGFSKVYQSKLNGMPVAVKIPRENGPSDQVNYAFSAYKSLLRERNAMREFNHINVLSLLKHYTMNDPDHIFLVCELIQGELSSRGYVQRKPDETVSFFHAIASGMEHIHLANFIHSDLKWDNVLIGLDGVPKVSDFGASIEAKESTPVDARQFTDPYTAPEIHNTGQVCKASDVYSFGQMLSEVVPLTQPLRRLADACKGQTPESRPTFEFVVRYLDALKNNQILPDISPYLSVINSYEVRAVSQWSIGQHVSSMVQKVTSLFTHGNLKRSGTSQIPQNLPNDTQESPKTLLKRTTETLEIPSNTTTETLQSPNPPEYSSACVKLHSSDGQSFSVPKDVLWQSGFLEPFQDCDDVPPLNVAGPVLAKVIEYAIHHKDDPPFIEDENKPKNSDDIEDWDREFISVDQGTLFELILAANYLDMKGLVDLGCKTVANLIKGKSVDEIRKTFNIVNDFTPEEEEQIRKENEWCEDR